MKKFFFIFLSFSLLILHAQVQDIDSLKKALSVAKEDTNKAFLLFTLYAHYKFADVDSALFYIQEHYQLSNKIKFDEGIRYSLLELGDMAQSLS